MAILTAGTQLYIIDPEGGDVVAVACATSITQISAERGQIETTCLEDTARSYLPGLATPGAAQVELSFDPGETSHVRLHELYVSGDTLDFALGMSDGVGVAPTSDSTAFTLPSTRSWLTWEGFIQNLPFDFALDSVVKSTLSIQISGFPVLTPKA